MNCEKFGMLVDDYLDTSLEHSESEALEEHLRECHECRQQVASLKSLLSRTASLSRNMMPERDFWPAIAAQIGIAGCPAAATSMFGASWVRGVWRNLRPGWRLATAAASGILILAAAALLSLRTPAPESSTLSERYGSDHVAGKGLSPQTRVDIPKASRFAGQPRPAPSERVGPTPRASAEASAPAGIRKESTPIYPLGTESRPVPWVGGQSTYPPEGIPRPDGSQDVFLGSSSFAVGGSAAYMWGNITTPSLTRQIHLRRWMAGQVVMWAILESTYIDTYAPLGIALSPDDAPHVAFVHQRRLSLKPTSEILRVDLERRIGTIIWISNTLVPGSFAVSRQGYLYIAGITEPEGRAASRNPSGTMMNLLHIIDPAGKEVASLLPISAANTSEALGLSKKAVLSVRSSGNFIVSLGLQGSSPANRQGLTTHEVREYSPMGLVMQTHTFPGLPENATIASALFDADENLIVQVVESVSDASGRGVQWSGSYLIKELKNSSEQIRLIDLLSPDESLVGVLNDGTLVMRYQPPKVQPFLRFRSQ